MSYTKENTGALWINDRKEKDTHPDLSGSITIDGVEYWLSGWNKAQDAHPRAPVLKLSVKRKDEVHKEGMSQANEALQPQQQAPTQPQQQITDDFEDVPF